uniref:Cytochrome b5 heme-binding domain-containing protein n=1 Tax=Palpitomonas bilix TaxID=652834 RepID=A0A7S3D168_9EUKA
MGKGGNRVGEDPKLAKGAKGKKGTPDNMWLEIEGKRYDVTNFAKVHPGGHVIEYFNQKDATEAYLSIHSRELLEKYKHLLVKEKTEPLPVTRIQQKFRALEEKYRKEGLYEPQPFFFFWQLAVAITLFFTAIYVFWAYNAWWTSAFIMGVSQVQFGWLMHDFGHRQVTCNSKLDRTLNFIVMNCFQGGNAEWWTSKHNRHHLLPNTLEHDPDIHTDPLFSFVASMKGGFWNKYQHLYFPILGPPIGVIFMAYLVFRHSINHKYWGIFLGMVVFNSVYFAFFGFLHYVVMRVVHGIWFQSVVAVNHFAETVLTREEADKLDWVGKFAFVLSASFFDEHHRLLSLPVRQ